MTMWSLRVICPSIVEDMGNNWVRKTSNLVNDIMVNLCGESVTVRVGLGYLIPQRAVTNEIILYSDLDL